MRYLVGFVFVVLVPATVGCDESAGAPDLVVQVCERELECRPPSQPVRPVEDCVESTRLRMQCLSPAETADFLNEVAACLEEPCERWFLSSCPPRLAPCPLDGPCVAPLGDYCAEVECPTWDEELVRIECPGNWEVGTCGGLRYVWHQFFGAADYYVRYFDSSGALVIQELHSDVNAYCDSTSWEIFYGQVPDCELEPTVLSREDCRSATP